MLDCRGKLLRVGDQVALSAHGTQVLGTLETDPDDIKYVRLQIRVSSSKIKYYDRASRRILNLTAFFEDELDRPRTIVLQ